MSFVDLRIRQEGTSVLVIKDGVTVLEMPWDAALAFTQEVRAKAKVAEELATVEKIISDGSILFRSGAPFSLSDNPDIVKETVKEAQYNRDLRRWMPGGIKSQAVMGVPAVYHLPRKEPAHG